jgi:radical SAM superfamily enzyme YgiQ (UPF0313 family)
MHADQGINKYVRTKSPKRFVEECKTLVEKYGVEMFYFVDGTFLVMSNDILEELAELFRKEVNKPFFCLTTVPSLSETRVRLLSEMGCVQVNMGVESGNEKYRKEVLDRPNMSNKSIVNAFKIMKKYNIVTSSFNMIGMPWQSRESVNETIKLNRMSKPDFINVSIFIPFEGTRLLDRLRKEGYIGDDIILGGETRATVDVPGYMTLDEIERLHKVFTLYCKVPDNILDEVNLCETDPVKYKAKIAELQEEYIPFESQLPLALNKGLQDKMPMSHNSTL